MSNFRKIIPGLVALIFFSGCASKKHESRLNGIQNQISYLTDSYNKLSMNLSEIQDSLLVLQSRVDYLKGSVGDRKPKSPMRLAKSKATVKKDVARTGKKTNADLGGEEVPVFELGAAKSELAGKPGEVFRLEDGEGFIKIEGSGLRKRISRVPREKEPKRELKTLDKNVTPKEFYEAAFHAYSKRKFKTAIQQFSDFLQLFPEHDLSDNAVYWIGESYVGMGEYALALPEFQRISIEYPNGNKVPDSLLMMGICFDKLNNDSNARESWKKLVMLFPDTLAAKKAKRRLESY